MAFYLSEKNQRFILAEMLLRQIKLASRNYSAEGGRCRKVANCLSWEELTQAGELGLLRSPVLLHLSHLSLDTLCNMWVEIFTLMCQQENNLVKSQTMLVFLWNWHKANKFCSLSWQESHQLSWQEIPTNGLQPQSHTSNLLGVWHRVRMVPIQIQYQLCIFSQNAWREPELSKYYSPLHVLISL